MTSKMMTRTQWERDLLITGIASMRRTNDENESLGASGRKYSHTCAGCEINSPGDRFACILCNHIVCSDCCSDGKCGHCFRGKRFVRLLEEDRSCALCCSTAPIKRVAFPKCGHTCCEPCAHQMSMDARHQHQMSFDARHQRVDLACPFCRTEISGYWIELEEMEENEGLEDENEADGKKIKANESNKPEKSEKKVWKLKRSGPTVGDSIASIQKRRRSNA